MAETWQLRNTFIRLCLQSMAALIVAIFAAVGAWADDGVVLELIGVEPDPAIPGQFPDVTDGHIKLIDGTYGNYSAEYSWSAPPKHIGPEGFPMTLQVQAENKTGGGITTGTGLGGSGFSFDAAEPVAWARVQNGAPGSDAQSLIVQVKPSGPLTMGSTAELIVGATWGPGVHYKYQAVGGTTGDDGTGGSGGTGDDGSQPPRRLAAEIECDKDEIVISALPSLSCHLHISGWQRNTANPVFVELPAAIDGFGNHANGIQVFDGPGEEDVFNWDEPERLWGLFVFACPSQTHTGANCFGSITTPGTVSVPIVVRQGDQSVNVMLTLTAVARGGGGSGQAAGSQVRLGNRWMAGDFINIESGRLVSGAIKADWLSAVWSIEPVQGSNLVRLRSAWKPEIHLHAENQAVEAGEIRQDWASALWALEPVEGTRYVRIRNGWRQDQYLHMEHGMLELGPIDQQWLSALWWTME